MPIKNGVMDLCAIITHLGELGYHDVWVEAGGAFFSALHRKGLVHRTYLYLVPTSLERNAISATNKMDCLTEPYCFWHAMGDNMIACLDWQEDTCLLV